MAAVLPPEIFSMIFQCLVDELPAIEPQRLFSTAEHIYNLDDSQPDFVDDPHGDRHGFCWDRKRPLDDRGTLWHPLEHHQPIRRWSNVCRAFRQEAIPVIFETVFVMTNRTDDRGKAVHPGCHRWSEDEEEQELCSPQGCFEYYDHAWRQLQALRYGLPHRLHLIKTFAFHCRMGDGYHDRLGFGDDDESCDITGDMEGEPTDHRGMLDVYLDDLTWILGDPKALGNATTLLLNTYQVGRPRVVEALQHRPRSNRILVYTSGAENAPDGIFVPYIRHFADVLCECWVSAGQGIPAEFCKDLRSITLSTALNLKFSPPVRRRYDGTVWQVGEGTTAIGSEVVAGLNFVAMFDLNLVGAKPQPIDLALNAFRPALKARLKHKRARLQREDQVRGVVTPSIGGYDDAHVYLTPADVREALSADQTLRPLRSQGDQEASAIADAFNEAEKRTKDFWDTAGQGW